MDDADMTADRIEREEEARRRYGTVLRPEAEPTGDCLYCGEEVEGVRWCCVSCRDMWQVMRNRGVV